jgi:branched-chain amino acid transport system ATP-binding protein
MSALLEVEDLHAYYGKSHILQGVNFHVAEGEIVSLLGRNGVGRSTTIKAIMGDVPPHGSIRFRDREIAGMKPHQVARLGLGYVPENRDIFPSLTVRQNLLLGQKTANQSGRWAMADMFRIFPRLEERADTPAGVLSGGEQQMLTMCRTLMGDPDLVMIDEPTEGLAPMMVELVGRLLEEIAARGIAILLVEQKLTIALKISHRLYVMGHGRIVFEGTPAEFAANTAVRQEWLEV